MKMRLFTTALLLLSLAMVSAAFSVKPDYLEIKDTGSLSLPALNVNIMVDCDSKGATITVLDNNTGLPVKGAKTYMFYTDYGYNALPNPGVTDDNGVAVMPVTGNIRYLTALFVLRADDSSYQSRQIEYTYEKCFQAQPPPPPPPPPVQNQTNTTPTPPPVQPPNESPNVTPPVVNVTPPTMNQTNQTKNETGQTPKSALPCPAGALILSLLFLRARQ